VRGVAGCSELTVQAAKNAAALGMPIQVNTVVSKETVDDLPAIYELLSGLNINAIGPGKVLQPISSEYGEQLMNWIYDLAGSAPFAIKTTEAPSYRRIALNRMEAVANEPKQSAPQFCVPRLWHSRWPRHRIRVAEG
jgi:MoaA/NifB/PqqE/SkfB family radical SAM enzyme